MDKVYLVWHTIEYEESTLCGIFEDEDDAIEYVANIFINPFAERTWKQLSKTRWGKLNEYIEVECETIIKRKEGKE